MSSDPRSWPDRLMGFCFGFLFAAIALYIGVQLIQSIWHMLLAILAVVVALVGMVAVWRHWRGW